MEKLTKGQGAPLLGMGERIVLAVIPEAQMTAYLIRRSKKFDKKLSAENATLIYTEADGIPNYVQQLALAAFEAAEGEIDTAAVYAGADGIVDRQVGDFAERFEQLAPSQQRTLKVLAAQPTKSVYTKSFLDNVGVANANAVRTALDAWEPRARLKDRWSVGCLIPLLRRCVETSGLDAPFLGCASPEPVMSGGTRHRTPAMCALAESRWLVLLARASTAAPERCRLSDFRPPRGA